MFMPTEYNQSYATVNNLRSLTDNNRSYRMLQMDGLDFSVRVRARRRQLGLSQEELGKAVGISQVSIKKIEAGGNTRHGRKLAEALKTTLKWLETGIDPETNVEGQVIDNETCGKVAESQVTYEVGLPRGASTTCWPLKKVSMERLNALTPKQQEQVDSVIDTLLRGYETEIGKKTPKN